MYCNTFFHQLAAHMLLSETCLLASQDLSSNKRICFDSNNTIETIAQSNINSEEGNLQLVIFNTNIYHITVKKTIS